MNIATRADGFIARRDRDVEWLNRHPDTIDYGMGELIAAAPYEDRVVRRRHALRG